MEEGYLTIEEAVRQIKEALAEKPIEPLAESRAGEEERTKP